MELEYRDEIAVRAAGMLTLCELKGASTCRWCTTTIVPGMSASWEWRLASWASPSRPWSWGRAPTATARFWCSRRPGPCHRSASSTSPRVTGFSASKRSASRRGRYGSTRAVPVIAVVSGAGRCSCPAARWPTSRAPARWPMASTRRTGRRAIPQRRRNERRRLISDGSPMPRWIKGRPVSVRGWARGPSGGLGAGPRDGTSPRTGHHGEVGSRRPPRPYLGGPGPRAFARLPKSPATRSRSVFSAWQV